MNNNRTAEMTQQVVLAISQQQDKLQAVCLRKQGTTFEVLWTKSSDIGQTNWSSFADQLGLTAGQIQTDGDMTIVAGFNSADVVFYRIEVPAAKKEETVAMVRLQTEARLPLPLEKMELAWRSSKAKNGQVAVTIAAARKEQLQKFVENVRDFRPARILLDCEGIVRVWRTLYSQERQKLAAFADDKPAVVISIGSQNTQVCLTEFGLLSDAVNLDMGIEDFLSAHSPTEQTEAAERFAQDTRSVLEMFGYAEPDQLPVFVLSDEGTVVESIVSCLEAAGLNAQAASPNTENLKAPVELTAKQIYEYRVPIGLALCALTADTKELNIFEHLYRPAGKEEKRHWLYTPKVAGAIAAITLVILIAVFYAVDVASYKRWEGSQAQANCNLLMQQKKLIKTVAQQRPDLLGLINEINSAATNGILLDSFDFKKGQPVRITGEAQNSDQIYKFEESLMAQKNIKEVKRPSTSQDSKTKKLKFTITFHYKNFTQKARQLQI